MSRSKNPRTYPDEITNLDSHFRDNPNLVLEIPFPTVEAAKSFRLSFYSFRIGIVTADKTKEDKGLLKSFPKLQGLMLKVLDDPPRLEVTWQDPQELADRIAQAVERAKQKLADSQPEPNGSQPEGEQS